MQASVDGQNVYWKLLDLLADNLKNSNTSPPELPSLGSWVMHVLHGVYNIGQKCTEWDLHKLFKNCFSNFKIHLIDMLTTFKLMICMNCISDEVQIYCFH